MYLRFLSSFKILAQGLLLTLPKQFPAECKQIKIQKNVTMPAKIIIIYHLQGHIHANPKKNAQKFLFHIIKIPLIMNGLTYNPAEHFTRFLLETRAKYSAGLYVKPFKKIYLLYIAVVLCVVIGQLHADKCDYHAICR